MKNNFNFKNSDLLRKQVILLTVNYFTEEEGLKTSKEKVNSLSEAVTMAQCYGENFDIASCQVGNTKYIIDSFADGGVDLYQVRNGHENLVATF